MSDGYPENKVLRFIRENVSLDRIREIVEKLVLYDSGDLDKYFGEALMESVYRGHKGSFKIQFSKGRGERYFYLVFCTSCSANGKLKRQLKNTLTKRTIS